MLSGIFGGFPNEAGIHAGSSEPSIVSLCVRAVIIRRKSVHGALTSELCIPHAIYVIFHLGGRNEASSVQCLPDAPYH